MVAYADEPEIDVDNVDVSDDVVTVEATVKRLCADCNAELDECAMTGEATIEHDCTEMQDGDEYDFEIVTDGDAEGTDRYETKTRTGKPIKSARYQKHYVGFSITPKVKCKRCGVDFDVTVEAEEQASSFESLV